MYPFKPIAFSVLMMLTGASVQAKRTIEYRDIQLQIQSNSNLSYAVAVLDKREVVVKQNQDPDFVGYIRSATGIAYPIVTYSENPFADDVALTIANGIQKSGAKVTTITTSFNMSAEEVIAKLKATGAGKLILVTIDEWRSDTRSRFADVATVMIWNFSLQILDVNGNQQADNKVEGRTDGVDPSMVSSAKKIKPIIDRYYKEKMEMLFGKENVLAGLKG
jgi:hypothetical protein